MFDFLAPYMTIIKVSVIGLIVAAIIGTYVYIKYQSGKITQLKSDNSKLSSAVEEQAKTIDRLKKDYDQIIKLKDEYVVKTKELQQQLKDLEETLFREREGKKSLETLLLSQKQSLVVRLINKSTKEVFRCFEIISGSPRTPADNTLVCKR